MIKSEYLEMTYLCKDIGNVSWMRCFVWTCCILIYHKLFLEATDRCLWKLTVLGKENVFYFTIYVMSKHSWQSYWNKSNLWPCGYIQTDVFSANCVIWLQHAADGGTVLFQIIRLLRVCCNKNGRWCCPDVIDVPWAWFVWTA